ncbi:MAG: hypothetical protein ABIQ32_06805 [Sphingomicrobium sp.]
MSGVTKGPTGVERARWLGELAEAIDAAQLVAWQVGAAGTHSAEALDLYCRLEAARDEIDRLRGGGWRTQRNEIGSKWTKFPATEVGKLR